MYKIKFISVRVQIVSGFSYSIIKNTMEFLASLFGLDDDDTTTKQRQATKRAPLGVIDFALNNQVRVEQTKGQRTIRYLPYERKVMDFENRQYVEKVPVKRKVQCFEERKVYDEVPREVTRTISVPVQKIIQYHKEIIPEKTVEMVPVEKRVKVVEMVPVEKQIVHVPEHEDPELFKHKVDSNLVFNFAVQPRPVSQLVAAPISAPVLVGNAVPVVGSHVMTLIPQALETSRVTLVSPRVVNTPFTHVLRPFTSQSLKND